MLMRSKAIPTFKIPESSACLDRYLRELHRIPLIDTEEEMQLAGRIRQGDEQALAALVRANLRFVVSIAKLYQHTYVPLMDLINEGNIGLVEAARRFDETKGFKFISYAVWWIRKSILAAISEQSRLVRLPDEKVKLVQQVDIVLNFWLTIWFTFHKIEFGGYNDASIAYTKPDGVGGENAHPSSNNHPLKGLGIFYSRALFEKKSMRNR